MDKLPISSKYRARPNDEVPDYERQQLSEQLNDAFSSGEVDQEQFEHLLDTVLRAQTLGELVPAVEALGRPDTYAEPAIVKQEGTLPPGEVSVANKPNPGLVKWVVGGTVGAGALVVLLILLVIFL